MSTFQDRVKAVNAWGIDVQNRCCTSVTALKMAKDMMIADDEIKTVLVCGGYRNSDFVDYTDKNMSMMYNLSAGGGALILRKGLNKNLLLYQYIIYHIWKNKITKTLFKLILLFIYEMH